MFAPDPLSTEGHVALIQAIKCTRGLDLLRLDADYTSGELPASLVGDDDWHIDAVSGKCPAFGLNFAPDVKGPDMAVWATAHGSGLSGSDGGLGFTGEPRKYAFLDDRPSRTSTPDMAFHHQFEVVALCISSNPRALGWVLGVCTWGYKVGNDQVVVPDTPVAGNRPSDHWISAATAWNLSGGGRRKIPGSSASWSR